MSKRLLAVILIAVFVLAIGGAGGYLWGTRQQQSLPRDLLTKQQSSLSNPPAQPLTSTPTSFPAAPPAASDQYFPTQQVPYPPDWPNDLRYPERLVLVQAASSAVPFQDGTKMWVAKHRYYGHMGTAEQELSEFFRQGGWEISDRNEQMGDPSTISFLVSRSKDPYNGGSVLLSTEVSNPNTTYILTTIRR